MSVPQCLTRLWFLVAGVLGLNDLNLRQIRWRIQIQLQVQKILKMWLLKFGSSNLKKEKVYCTTVFGRAAEHLSSSSPLMKLYFEILEAYFGNAVCRRVGECNKYEVSRSFQDDSVSSAVRS